MNKIEIYSKSDCHLCDEAKAILVKVQKKIPFDLVEIDITKDSALFEQFKETIPVIFVNGKKSFKFKINEDDLIKKLYNGSNRNF